MVGRGVAAVVVPAAAGLMELGLRRGMDHLDYVSLQLGLGLVALLRVWVLEVRETPESRGELDGETEWRERM